MKKLLALMLAVAMVLSIGTSALANTDLTAAKEALKNIPDVSAFTSAKDPGFEEALVSATDIIYTLAELSEEDMMSLDGYEDAFMTFLQLALMTYREDMPTEVTTKDNFDQHYAWYENMITATDLMYEINASTAYTPVDPEDEYGSTQGEVLLEQLGTDYMNVMLRLYSYLSTLSEEENKALQVNDIRKTMDMLPEEFTMENIWEAGSLFMSLRDVLSGESVSLIETVTLSDLPAEDAARFNGLSDQFDAFVESHRDAMLIAVDEAIVTNCDVETASGYSPLKLQLVASPIVDEIWNMIYLLESCFYDIDVTIELANYGIFEEYEALVYPESVYYSYGDLDENYSVDAGDALMVLKYAVGTQELTDYQLVCGDVSGEGSVDAVDALYILQYAVGNREYFPVEEEYIIIE